MFEVAGRRTSLRGGVLHLGLGLFGAAGVAAFVQPAAAGGLTTLYAYCAQAGCADGAQPEAAMILGSDGYLYGTTFYGGESADGADSGYGTVFRRRGSRAPEILLAFCGACAVGANPLGALIMDVNGHLYGTATNGGAHGQGTVFELVPNAKRTRWKVGHLYSFCAEAGCTDGSNPAAGLTYKGAETGALYDGTSPLYGTTLNGGTKSYGTVFQVVPGDRRFKEKVLYSFCIKDGCTDGANPGGALLTDSSGNFYGTTRAGGVGAGTVFKLKQKGTGYVQTVLHAFGTGGDGTTPNSALVWDGAGNLVGTAEQGGAKGSGAVFRVTPSGANSPESLVYSFCQQTNCLDGDQPKGGVVVGANGDLFGVTRNGGSNGLGVAYRLTGSSETVVYNLCAQGGFCPDGAHPEAGLVSDGSGGFFGTTVQGGIHGGGGIVFRLTP